MGSLFSSPSPPPPQPLPSLPDPEEAERKRRLAAIDRRRRGRAGTIVTSDRGILEPSDWVPRRKNLLGE